VKKHASRSAVFAPVFARRLDVDQQLADRVLRDLPHELLLRRESD